MTNLTKAESIARDLLLQFGSTSGVGTFNYLISVRNTDLHTADWWFHWLARVLLWRVSNALGFVSGRFPNYRADKVEKHHVQREFSQFSPRHCLCFPNSRSVAP